MIDGRRVLAVVPARSGSKGLPDKNIRMLGGKPLLAWPIEAARRSRYVDRAIVSTDSEKYRSIAAEYGADCPFLRPADLAGDEAPSFAFIEHALDQLEAEGETYDIFVLLEPTSPLTEAQDVDNALQRLIGAAERGAEAIVGVSRMETQHPAFAVLMDEADGAIRPAAGGTFEDLPRRQDLPPIYALDGSLYISTVSALRREKGFCHSGTLGYPTDRYKSHEVDDLVDFIAIEAILDNLPLLRRNSR